MPAGRSHGAMVSRLGHVNALIATDDAHVVQAPVGLAAGVKVVGGHPTAGVVMEVTEIHPGLQVPYIVHVAGLVGITKGRPQHDFVADCGNAEVANLSVEFLVERDQFPSPLRLAVGDGAKFRIAGVGIVFVGAFERMNPRRVGDFGSGPAILADHIQKIVDFRLQQMLVGVLRFRDHRKLDAMVRMDLLHAISSRVFEAQP